MGSFYDHDLRKNEDFSNSCQRIHTGGSAHVNINLKIGFHILNRIQHYFCKECAGNINN